MTKFAEVLKKILGNSEEVQEVVKKISRNLMKTLGNCEENVKEPPTEF